MVREPRRSSALGRGALGAAAQAIVERRLALGITQIDLAELAGISPATVRTIETGHGRVRLDTLLALLDVLGLALVVAPKPTAVEMADAIDAVMVTMAAFRGPEE